jgi:hypothetical protein
MYGMNRALEQPRSHWRARDRKSDVISYMAASPKSISLLVPYLLRVESDGVRLLFPVKSFYTSRHELWNSRKTDRCMYSLKYTVDSVAIFSDGARAMTSLVV